MSATMMHVPGIAGARICTFVVLQYAHLAQLQFGQPAFAIGMLAVPQLHFGIRAIFAKDFEKDSYATPNVHVSFFCL
jgi:hypothetical protein